MNLEDEKIFDKIENHKIYDQIVSISLDDENEDEEDEENKQQKKNIKRIKKNIRRKFEEYYETFYESREGDLKFKFPYRNVEKDNFGLEVTDILQIDDELLEESLPSHNIKIQDSVGKVMDKEEIAKKINNKLSKNPIEKKKRMKKLTRVKRKEMNIE